MNREAASAMSVADIKAYGPAPDEETLSVLLGRLADLALSLDRPCLWGWLVTLGDMPDKIGEMYIPKLEEARDRIGRSDLYAVGILDAAISVLRRP